MIFSRSGKRRGLVDLHQPGGSGERHDLAVIAVGKADLLAGVENRIALEGQAVEPAGESDDFASGCSPVPMPIYK